MGRCRLLQRIRNALHGGGCCSGGCCGPAYTGDWNECPACDCEPCDCYGNNIGGPYASPHGRRARMANRSMNLSGELSLGEAGDETIYR